MQQTICAKVNPRLLTKADRLFTGTAEGRIIEILQNARRAGATEVRIANKDGYVIVEDNGSGIADFQKLLDLGGSGWDEKMEASEDPAGVGLFSLAPREVTIQSGNQRIAIDKDGWMGKPVTIELMQDAINGTILKFKDEKPWDLKTVEKHVVFAGNKVVVDGESCHSIPFCSGKAAYYGNPGCRIDVVQDVTSYHKEWLTGWYSNRVLVNFHGQIVQLEHWPCQSHPSVNILIDITGPTSIRLMLPARTQLVENEAYERLKAAIELEFYRYVQKQKSHTLLYSEYLRAKELGIELPEAEPQFRTGLIRDECELAVGVDMPENFPLKDCYLCDDIRNDTDEANVHLLGALGRFKYKSFVPVTIESGYIGYSWTNLAKATKVTVNKSKQLFKEPIWCGEIACFDRLMIKVETSDGLIFSSEVPMLVISEVRKGKVSWSNDVVCVTREARERLSNENIWYHLGGFNCEGDSFDTQLYNFGDELDEVWNKLIGPYESIRQQLMDKLYSLRGEWQKVTISKKGSLEIQFKNGKKELVKPPE